MSEKKPSVGERLEALCEKWIGELETALVGDRADLLNNLIRLMDFVDIALEKPEPEEDKVDYEGLANRVADILVEKAGELPPEDGFDYMKTTNEMREAVEGLDPSAAYMEAAVTRDEARAMSGRPAAKPCGTPVAPPIPPMPKVERVTFQVFPKKLEARKETGEIIFKADALTEVIMLWEEGGSRIVVGQFDGNSITATYYDTKGDIVEKYVCTSLGIPILNIPVKVSHSGTVVNKDRLAGFR